MKNKPLRIHWKEFARNCDRFLHEHNAPRLPFPNTAERKKKNQLAKKSLAMA